MVFASSFSTVAAETENAERDLSEIAQIKQENYENVMSGQVETLPTQIGETKTVFEDENGTMTVTLVEATSNDNDLARGFADKSHTYVYNYKNIFGVTKEAFRVSLYCLWNSNGVNSYISNFVASCSISDNSFSYSWDSNEYRTDAYHARYLNIYHNGGSTFYIFSASLVLTNNPYVTFAGTAYLKFPGICCHYAR